MLKWCGMQCTDKTSHLWSMQQDIMEVGIILVIWFKLSYELRKDGLIWKGATAISRNAVREDRPPPRQPIAHFNWRWFICLYVTLLETLLKKVINAFWWKLQDSLGNDTRNHWLKCHKNPFITFWVTLLSPALVCWSVGLLATWLKKYWTDFYEIFKRPQLWHRAQLIINFI